MHHFLVSAAHKSSGKTTLSIGLCAALRRQGKSVQAFKKGPDYIDPLWLAQATGRACYNLDPYLSSNEEIRRTVAGCSNAADVCVVEGNKGLFDGLALDGSNSNAALAGLLGLPVILVLDARGMTRGIAPLILGYQAFDRSIRIAGVILNRLGGSRHESKLRTVIEHYTDVPVLGAMQENSDFGILERHLGLAPSSEVEAAAASIEKIAQGVEASIDLDRLLKLTESSSSAPSNRSLAQPHDMIEDNHFSFRVGIIQDRAFCFYYADDLDAFKATGASIVYIDSLTDSKLPEIDALFIGGGFPEVLAPQLEANQAFRQSLYDAIEQGMPCYAECGGLMYLARSITWQDKVFPMVGALPIDIVMHRKPVGRGYVNLEETGAALWPQQGSRPLLLAHEFHYSSVTNMSPDVQFAYRVKRGYGVDGKHDGIIYRNVLANYAHMRNTGGNEWVARFVTFARRIAYRNNR
jgi:cobyrinic acid a,c-diamide synthase